MAGVLEGENEFYPPSLQTGVSNEKDKQTPAYFSPTVHLLSFVKPERECSSTLPKAPLLGRRWVVAVLLMSPLGSPARVTPRVGGFPAPETTGTGFRKTSPGGGPGASPPWGGILIVQPELPGSPRAEMCPRPGGDRDPPLRGRRDVVKTRQNRSTRRPDVCQEERRFPEPLAGGLAAGSELQAPQSRGRPG